MNTRTVAVNAIVNAAGYVSGMDAVQKKTRETTKDASARLAEQKAAMESVGRASLAMGAIAGAGVLLAVSRFAEFDQAMSNVQASTHESASNMGLLRDAALDAGASTVFSATESANAIDELAKAGISTSDIMSGALAGALDLASAGGLGVARAAEISATALQQFNLTGSDAGHVADVLAAGAGKAMGSVEDLANGLKFVGPVAASMGVSIEETTGTLALFAQQGIIGEQAGTSLRGVLSSLTAPSAQASAEIKRLNINLYDSNGKFLGIKNAAGQLAQAYGDMDDKSRQASLGIIFGRETITAATALYKAGAKGVQEWTGNVNDSGYAADTARMKLDNLNGDLEALGGAIDTGLIKSGSAANDVLRGLVQGLTGIAEVVADLPAPVLGAGLAIGSVASAVGLVGGTALLAIPKIAEFRGAWKTLAADAPEVTSKLKGVSSFLAGPWGVAIGTAIAMLGAIAISQQTYAREVDSLTDTLDRNTGAFTENTRAAVAKTLQDKGILDAAKGLGLSLQVVTDAAMGNAKQMAIVKAAQDEYNSSAGEGTRLAEGLWEGMGGATSSGIVGALEGVNGQLDASKTKLDETKEATNGAKTATDSHVTSLETLAGQSNDTANQIDDLAQAIRDFGQTQFDVNSTSRDFEAAIDTATEKLEAQAEAFVRANGSLDGYTNSLDIGTAAGRENQAAIDAIASSANASASAILVQTGSVDQSTAALDRGRDALRNQLAQFGITGAAADVYIGKLLSTPSEVATQAKLSGIDEAEAILSNLARNRTALIQAAIEAGAPAGQANAAYKADGGAIYGPGGPRDDKIPAMLSNGEHVLTASDVQAMGGQAAVYQFRSNLRGFADGGAVAPPVYSPAYASGGGSVASVVVSPVVSLRGATLQLSVDGRQMTAFVQDQIVQADTSNSMNIVAGVGR